MDRHRREERELKCPNSQGIEGIRMQIAKGPRQERRDQRIERGPPTDHTHDERGDEPPIRRSELGDTLPISCAVTRFRQEFGIDQLRREPFAIPRSTQHFRGNQPGISHKPPQTSKDAFLLPEVRIVSSVHWSEVLKSGEPSGIVIRC